MAEIPLPQAASRLLQKRGPTRVVVFVRTKSPFYPLGRDDIVLQACNTLGVDATQSRAKLLTVMKEHRLNIFCFDLWYDGYDWATAHHPVDLPILLVDYGKRLSAVKVAATEFRDRANRRVAGQHEHHGWGVKPPYFEDGTAAVRSYPSPRLVGYHLEDGTRARVVKTPPPGSISAYPPYDVECPNPSLAQRRAAKETLSDKRSMQEGDQKAATGAGDETTATGLSSLATPTETQGTAWATAPRCVDG